MKVSIIVALDQKRGIGKDNKMPWYIPEDLKRFKKITMGHPIVMGRKTYESLGKPLAGRTNIVITHNSLFMIQGVEVVYSLSEALRLASLAQGNDECFIIGGGQIFTQAIALADKLYLTIVEGEFETDTYFPDYSEFKKVTSEENGDSGGIKYTFLELERAGARNK